MNSSVPFDFSIDNDNEPAGVVDILDSAAQHGWKVKLVYHETWGKNWFNNRGETNHFVKQSGSVRKNFGNMFNGSRQDTTGNSLRGHIIDTIYLIIDKSKQ